MSPHTSPRTDRPETSGSQLDEPLLVLVASDDPTRLERARAVATFVPDVRVTEARSSASVVRLVTSLYERPVGCPDIVVLDEAMAGAREAAAWLRETCSGVRIVGLGSDDGVEGLAEALREQAAAVEFAAR